MPVIMGMIVLAMGAGDCGNVSNNRLSPGRAPLYAPGETRKPRFNKFSQVSGDGRSRLGKSDYR